jgi:hypothetical protein
MFQDWNESQSQLVHTALNPEGDTRYDVETAVQQAVKILQLESTEYSGYVVPLFQADDPIPTNEYVVYNPDRNVIRWYDTNFGLSGTDRNTATETIAKTTLADRLQYWLPDQQPEPDLQFDEAELPPDELYPQGNHEPGDFFADLKSFVLTERENDRESNRELYAESSFERLLHRNQIKGPFLSLGKTSLKNGNKGYSIQYLQEEEEDDDDIDLFEDVGIYPDSIYLVDVRHDDDSFPLEATTRTVSEGLCTLEPRWESVANRSLVEKKLLEEDAELYLYQILNPVPFDRRIRAIRELERDTSKRELLTGERSPVSFTVNRFQTTKSAIDLNHYQQLAILWADSAEDLVCIHGPPGTGKTRTLTAIAERAVRQGKKVLVTAHSNQAVDNLLVGDSTLDNPESDTLHALSMQPDRDITIARAGNNSHNRVVQGKYVNPPSSTANIIAATTSGAAQFDKNQFDIGILDEATQASRPATAIAFNAAKKLILAGDHKQLPPYVSDEEMAEQEMHISLFEYLLERFGEDLAIQLRKQYRMNSEIAAFPNEEFYDGLLETAEQNADWVVDNLKPIMGIDIDGVEQRPETGHSYYNQQEAEAVAKQVKLLHKSGLATEDIGVITAYSGQTGPIKNEIHDLDIPYPGRVDVATVDSFQGGEREAIIVSFVRSNGSGYSGFLEFPDEGARRLNVALTRARKRLVLIGNWETLGTTAPHRTRETSCAHHYANLESHLEKNNRML